MKSQALITFVCILALTQSWCGTKTPTPAHSRPIKLGTPTN